MFDATYDIRLCEHYNDDEGCVGSLKIKGGALMLDGLVQRCPEAAEFHYGLRGVAEVSVWDALQALGRPRFVACFGQFVVRLALEIEAGVHGACQGDAALSAEAHGDKFSQNQKFKGLRAKLLKFANRDGKGLVVKYFFSGRRHFDQARAVSYTCDATRMGKVQVLDGAMSLPTNIFMWAPPQAICPNLHQARCTPPPTSDCKGTC